MMDELKERLGPSRFSTTWSTGSGWLIEEAVRQARETDEGSEPKAAVPGRPAETSVESKPKHVTTTGEIRIPGSLQVHALGPLRILLNRRLLERDAWNSAKPRELLLFLMARPEGCTREQVGLAFWP
jgi:hypothetical protein